MERFLRYVIKLKENKGERDIKLMTGKIWTLSFQSIQFLFTITKT